MTCGRARASRQGKQREKDAEAAAFLRFQGSAAVLKEVLEQAVEEETDY